MSSQAHELEYWYCVKHHEVEVAGMISPGTICPILDRLGPYSSYDAAARALETAKERNEAWDSDDWDD